MGAEHFTLLFHTEARWLSRGKILGRIFELRHEVFCFLIEEKHHLAAEFFSNEEFLLKTAYLADIFEKLNILNKSLKKNEANILTWNRKVEAFVKKLTLWESCLESNDIKMFLP